MLCDDAATLSRHVTLHRSWRQGKKIFFVTNNATKSRKNYKKKFDQLGVEAQVVSPAAGGYIYPAYGGKA